MDDGEMRERGGGEARRHPRSHGTTTPHWLHGGRQAENPAQRELNPKRCGKVCVVGRSVCTKMSPVSSPTKPSQKLVHV